MQKYRIPGCILMILSNVILGGLMIYSMVTDDFPDTNSHIGFIIMAIICFGAAAFYGWLLYRGIRKNKNKR